MQELVIPTSKGPVVFRPRRVVKCEGAFFVIESVNQVPNGRQVRMYHINDQEALKHYVPLEPNPGINAASGEIPPTGSGFHTDQSQAGTVAQQQPAAQTPPPPPPPQMQPPPPAADNAAPSGSIPGGDQAGPGEVPPAAAPGTGEPSKPIQGLSQEEVQEGLATGKYYSNSDGDVFLNPEYKDPSDPNAGAAPNHVVDPSSADK